MGAKTKGSVGKRGKNDAADVKTIQDMLNKHTKAGGFKKLKPDGISGKKTIGAINEFQTNVAGFKKGDGRVDCGKNTFKALCKSPGAVAKESAKKSDKKGAGKVTGKTTGVKKELLVFLQAVADHYGTTLTITRGKFNYKKVAMDMLGDSWGPKLWKRPLFVLAIHNFKTPAVMKEWFDLHQKAMDGEEKPFLHKMENKLSDIGYLDGEVVDLAKNTPANVRAALKTGLYEWPHSEGIYYDMKVKKPPKVTDKLKRKWKK